MSELPSVPGYRLLSLLGEGGMSLVYLAEDALLGRRTTLGDDEGGIRFIPGASTSLQISGRTDGSKLKGQILLHDHRDQVAFRSIGILADGPDWNRHR